MKLYEIDQAILNCIDLETGEIIDTDGPKDTAHLHIPSQKSPM